MNLLFRLKLDFQRRKSDWFAVFLLAAWPLAFFWPATFRQAVFSFGDIFLFFYPTHVSYANALRAFQLPLWEPNMLTGFPLYAEGQIGALYPLHPFLYGLLPIDIATNYDILLHLVWVSIGAYLLARTLKLQPPSAFLTAFAFGTSGFFYARLQHMSVLATASWLPWLMWAWECYERETDPGKRLRWIALLMLMSGAQLLGGHPQFAFSSALLLALYAAVRWDRGDRTRPPLWAPRGRWWLAPIRWVFEYFNPLRWIPLGLVFVTGAALAAAQLVPTFELASFTNRAGGLDARFFNAFSLRPVHFLMLFDPFIAGNPYPAVSVEVVGYVGMLAVIFAVLAISFRRDRRVTFWIAIALVALFLGLGDQNVFYRALRHLPLFNYFRVPSRFLYWFAFAAAMLAGITFDYFLTRARPVTRLARRHVIALVAIVVVIAVLVGIVPAVPLDRWLAVWQWLPLVLIFVTAWIVLGARRGLFPRPMLVTLVLAISMIDMACFAAVYSKTYDQMTTVADFYRPPDSVKVIQDLDRDQERVLTSLWIYPWQVVMRESLYPNISLIYGVPNGTGYTPLLMQRTSDYLEEITAPMLNLMNVRYYFIPQLLPSDPVKESGDVWNPFLLNPVGRDVVIPPTAAVKLKITSSAAQSVDWRMGQEVATIYLKTQDGNTLALPLKVGQDIAEWAYERTDVRKVIPYAMPTVATSFPAYTSFPTEAHTGHSFLAEFDLGRGGPPPVITGLYVYPKVNEGLLHVEQVHLVTPDGNDVSVAHLVGRDDQSMVYRSNDVAIFENPDFLPRTFIVHSAHVADDLAAEHEMFREGWKPSASLIIAAGEPLQVGAAQTAGESARVIEYQDQRVVISVRANADGYVLLTDAWYPGWVARLDGVEVPIQRADLIYRAVRVSPGEHRIEFEYRPASLYQGLAITGLALLVVAGLLVQSRRARPIGI